MDTKPIKTIIKIRKDIIESIIGLILPGTPLEKEVYLFSKEITTRNELRNKPLNPDFWDIPEGYYALEVR